MNAKTFCFCCVGRITAHEHKSEHTHTRATKADGRRPLSLHSAALHMPYDNNGNYVETCGDMCLSNRFAKDSGNAAAVQSVPAQLLCGFGCGAYGDPQRGDMCAKCIKERGMEEYFPVQPTAGTATLAATADSSKTRATDLVELVALDATIVLDIKYARTDNFMGRVLYPSAHAMLQRPAAEALVRVHAALRSQGLGLIVYDAYRPAAVTRAMWDETPEAQRIFVADPAVGSKHNRGCAVDVTLCSSTGVALPMPSAFDEFTERAFADFEGGTAEERSNRAMLRGAMEREGFSVNPKEWWHFDYYLWPEYPVLDVPFPPS